MKQAESTFLFVMVSVEFLIKQSSCAAVSSPHSLSFLWLMQLVWRSFERWLSASYVTAELNIRDLRLSHPTPPSYRSALSNKAINGLENNDNRIRSRANQGKAPWHFALKSPTVPIAYLPSSFNFSSKIPICTIVICSFSLFLPTLRIRQLLTH